MPNTTEIDLNFTGEQRAVETLRLSDARYRRLFETAQDGILILDADTGQVVDANPFMKDLLGYSQEEFLGRKLWEIGPFKGEDASKSAFAELQRNDRLHYEGLPLETKDGRRVEVFSFVQGYRKGVRVARTIGHGAADVMTLGLWEVVGTPTEATLNGHRVAYEVTYDASDRIDRVVLLKK